MTDDGPMYHLDPDKLGEIVGATYADCVFQTYSAKTIEYIREVAIPGWPP